MNNNIKTYKANNNEIIKNHKNEKPFDVNNTKNIIKNIKYNKVINIFRDDNNNNTNELKPITNNPKIEINKNEYIDNYNFEKSRNIEPLKDLALVENTIGQQKIEPMNQFQNKNLIKNDNNKKELNETIAGKIEEKVNEEENNKNIIEKGELDLTYNFNDDVYNVTQEQMGILDEYANKIYKKYQNNIKMKNFNINYPKWKNDFKMINNNIIFFPSKMTGKEKMKRISPIIAKQKLILEKIKKDNASRINLSLSNNNDSINKTQNNANTINNINYPYKLNQFNNNSNDSNENIYERNNYNQYERNYKYNSNTINNNQHNNYYNIKKINNYNNRIINERYQNIYKKESQLSENKSNGSNTKLYNKKIDYEPYTLDEYRLKYPNDKIRKLGGLGADIGGDAWRNRQMLFERKMLYSEYIKGDEENKKQNKRIVKVKTESNEISKTISPKKALEYSSDKLLKEKEGKNNYKYNIIKTENNNISRQSRQLRLPLIKERFKSSQEYNINNKINLKKSFDSLYNNKIYTRNSDYEFIGMNPGNGNGKDLNEIIRQYEMNNGKNKI